MKSLHNKKVIGIWGYGIVGKAVRHALINHGITPVIMDRSPLNDATIPFIPEHNKTEFFTQCDAIIPSPGIDLRPDLDCIKEKLISELDLFGAWWKKPIIAITGSVGKTTVTSFLSQLMQHYGTLVATGGNIGIGSLDLLEQQKNVSYGLLEVSSTQLHYCQSFAPDLAILTNIHPNHLDMHGSLEQYIQAKCQLFAYQKSNQTMLIPHELYATVMQHAHPQAQIYTFDDTRPHTIPANIAGTFFWENDHLVFTNTKTTTILLPKQLLPPSTFEANWLVLCSTLHLLNYNLETLPETTHALERPEHRMELVSSNHPLQFYNDSKSTTMASTQAAIKLLGDQPIILFLGGLSKGTDREPLIHMLPDTIKTVYCFGKEAKIMHNLCKKHNKKSYTFDTLDDAFNHCLDNEHTGIVLFSPAGSSFDLFSNFEERGQYFKHLITKIT